ncbi:hypothetical protein NC651_016775 [Populus alba x Populus x berolinensis]|nr:hypothetical protein NC651_016775 [Populus alba x Populus x berolinensis]
MNGLRKQRRLSFALPVIHTLDSNFSIKLTTIFLRIQLHREAIRFLHLDF